MNIIEQLNWRYATKSFDSEKSIPEKDIDVLTEAFNLTATSYGLQPIKLLIIKNKDLQSALVPFSYNQKQVGEASHLLVFCIESQIDTPFVSNYFDRVKAIRNTPDDILNPFKTFLIEDFKTKTQAEKEAWAAKQVYLAMGNLMTVCAMLKIDACPMEGFSPSDYDRLLELEALQLKSVLVMPIGYRAEDDFMAALDKVRRPIEESVIRR
ncbi:NAD(P)H-dependent oxidoreductase [Olleya sp. Bg11-27]|uniref:NAD(P)H-dependent oxidoreductase n=1 Tax=Olleya sp. Bg11-27 TaxID=2058135 RepID=UPI000C30FC4C|nr:NAD(P)H-dependent oxidoreductase [Olleya sp. Bg11-27]AUC76161.1 NAD(P)H-dependent oxidoreductase [Olleya sp. Bg11-27]